MRETPWPFALPDCWELREPEPASVWLLLRGKGEPTLIPLAHLVHAPAVLKSILVDEPRVVDVLSDREVAAFQRERRH